MTISKTKNRYKSRLSFTFNLSRTPYNDAFSYMYRESQGILNPNYGWSYITYPADENGNYEGDVKVNYWRKCK